MSSWSSLLLLLLVEGQQHLANAIEVEVCQYPVDLFRLPRRFQPTDYRAILRVNPMISNFWGEVWIDFYTQEMDTPDLLKSRTISKSLPYYASEPKTIILNAQNIKDINSLEVTKGRSKIPLTSICRDPINNIMVLTLLFQMVPRDIGQLYINYNGELSSNGREPFSSIEGDQWMLPTDNPSEKRQLFPCFDDPEFKATFKLTVIHPLGTTAISNMAKKRTKHPQFEKSIFKITPKMPSYLLFLMVGKFNFIKKIVRKDKLPVALYSPEISTKEGTNLLRKVMKVCDYVNEFFGPLPQWTEKIDIVAVNKDPGLKEHFGLITLNVDSLIPKPSTFHDAKRDITTLMNGVIHQWLSSVTMGWWDDLWLKEGIVAYLASELALHYEPNKSNELLVDTTISTMNDDDDPAKSYRIMDEKFKRPEEFVASFDSFAHKKSAAIVRMFAGFVGKDNFNSAIRGLIQSDAGGKPVEVDELWERLSINAPEHGNMKEVARKWALNQGYPTLCFTLEGDSTVFVSQWQDLAGGQVWSVPIKYNQHTADLRTDTRAFVLSGVEETFELAEPFNINDENQWLTFNHKSQGYYRVVYRPDTVLTALGRAILSNQIPPADRLHLLSDSYSRFKRTHKTNHFERMLKFFERETDDGVMLLLIEMLHSIPSLQNPNDSVMVLLMHYYNYNGNLSWGVNQVSLNQHVRGQVVNYLVNRLEHPAVINDLEDLIENGDGLPSSLELALQSPPLFEHIH